MFECLSESYHTVSIHIEDDIKQEISSNNKVGCDNLEIKQAENNVQDQEIFKKVETKKKISYNKQENLANDQSCSVRIIDKHDEKYYSNNIDEFEDEDYGDDMWYTPCYDGKSTKAKNRILERKHSNFGKPKKPKKGYLGRNHSRGY